jgi:hypothetical protein
MFIDHPGKDGKLRGSSAKSCNADFEIEIERDERTGVSQVKTNKVRDEQRGPVCSFRLLQVDLPNGRTSRIVEAIDAPVISVSRKPIDRESQAGIALTELEHLIIGGHAQRSQGNERIPDGAMSTISPDASSVVDVSDWRRACDRKGITPSSNEDTRRKTFNRARETLSRGGAIGFFDERVWLIRDKI